MQPENQDNLLIITMTQIDARNNPEQIGVKGKNGVGSTREC
jgi:hypothetical protein